MSNAKNILTLIKNKEVVSSKLLNLLYSQDKLSTKEASYLYSVAQLIISEYSNKELTNKFMLINYAYTIIAITSFKIKDFRALYDFSINYGFYPVAKHITNLGLIEDPSISHLLSDIGLDDYSNNDKTLTYEQHEKFQTIIENKSSMIGFFAPTSYGKSEIIFSHIKENKNLNVIGIIVPTKALIYQVFLDAKNKITDRKIIVHDQNFEKENDSRILAVVTQERALRLIEAGLIFDMLYIDEAHEILKFDFSNKINNRSLLITRLIKLARKLNPKLKEMYLSPVVDDSNNLALRNSGEIESHKINKDLKILDINYLNNDKQHLIYDRFLGEYIYSKDKYEIIEYINKFSKSKNLHFLYKPSFIESFANELDTYITIPPIDENIQNLIDEIKNIVHPKYNLAKLLKKGIIYLHGAVPQMVRNYLIDHVKKSQHIRHFVANTVILGGMNLPIDSLFYYAGNKNVNDLFNLIGRVNRLNLIFNQNNKDLSKIFIPVNFVDNEKYKHFKNSKTMGIIELLRGKVVDNVKNPLLKNALIDPRNKEQAKAIIENEVKLNENFKNPDFSDKLLKGGAQQLFNYTDLGKIKLEQKIKHFDKEITKENLLKAMKELFVDGFVYYDDYIPNEQVIRLRYDDTIKFYNNFIKQLNQKNLRERIDSMVEYWMTQTNKNYKIYVGKSFGEVKFDERSNVSLYIELDKYKDDEDKLHNFAIIKQQLDEDFISFEILKILTTMLEFGLIKQDLLDDFLYGTGNKKDLMILRSGIGRSLYKKLIEDQMVEYIYFDQYGNLKAKNEMRKYIEKQAGIIKFELELYFM